MLNYNDYINEKKEENGLAEFIYSKEFGDILIKLKKYSPIANELIDLYDNHENVKRTFIDVTKDENRISFIYDVDVIDIDKKSIWSNRKRKKVKIGKFLKSLLKDKYLEFEIERFVNFYKSEIRKFKTYFKIFKGEELSKWYNIDNMVPELGTLGSSCMRYERCQEYFDLYKKNPDKISLLVLFEIGNDKSIGRSLLWELNDGIIFMDRIYYSYDCDKILFKNYALENNISINSHDHKNGIEKIYTYLKPKDYEYYPYLDTMFIYQPETGLITDTITYCDKSKKSYILDDTFGGKRLLNIDY